MEDLQKFFSNQKTAATTPATGSLTQKGNYLNALSVALKNLSPWIVDSGASAHMAGNAACLQSYKPCQQNFTTKIANGSLSQVAGQVQ